MSTAANRLNAVAQEARQAAEEEKAAAKAAKAEEKAAAKGAAEEAKAAKKDAKEKEKAAKEKEKAEKAAAKAAEKAGPQKTGMTLGEGDEFENPNAEPDPEEAAAVKIQAMHRGNAARKEMNANGADAAGDDAETEAAAIKIQAMHRGNAARKQQASAGGEGAEEGVPPEEGQNAGDVSSGHGEVEVSPMDDDTTGQLIYKFILRLLQLGASISGGSEANMKDGADTVKVKQDRERTDLEFTLDEDNCIKDITGRLVKAARVKGGLAIGLKLTQVNEMAVVGWPGWMVKMYIEDPDTAWPMEASFQACNPRPIRSTTVWVGNIPDATVDASGVQGAEQALLEAFSVYGAVVGVSVREKKNDSECDRPVGKQSWGVVSFERPWAMKQAMSSATEVDGQELDVKISETTIWVGNIVDEALKERLPGQVEAGAAAVEDALKQLFAKYGEVVGVSVKETYNDKRSSRAVGRQSWALVSFDERASLEKAMEAAGDCLLNSEILTLRIAEGVVEETAESRGAIDGVVDGAYAAVDGAVAVVGGVASGLQSGGQLAVDGVTGSVKAVGAVAEGSVKAVGAVAEGAVGVVTGGLKVITGESAEDKKAAAKAKKLSKEEAKKEKARKKKERKAREKAALEQAKENIAKLGAFHCDGDINAFGMRTVGTVQYDFELLKSAFGNPTSETAGRPASPSAGGGAAASHVPSEVEWRVMGVYDTQRMIVQVIGKSNARAWTIKSLEVEAPKELKIDEPRWYCFEGDIGDDEDDGAEWTIYDAASCRRIEGKYKLFTDSKADWMKQQEAKFYQEREAGERQSTDGGLVETDERSAALSKLKLSERVTLDFEKMCEVQFNPAHGTEENVKVKREEPSAEDRVKAKDAENALPVEFFRAMMAKAQKDLEETHAPRPADGFEKFQIDHDLNIKQFRPVHSAKVSYVHTSFLAQRLPAVLC